MKKRAHIIVSVPQDFLDKFMGFIKNLNAINDDKEEPIIVEKVRLKKNYAIVPSATTAKEIR